MLSLVGANAMSTCKHSKKIIHIRLLTLLFWLKISKSHLDQNLAFPIFLLPNLLDLIPNLLAPKYPLRIHLEHFTANLCIYILRIFVSKTGEVQKSNCDYVIGNITSRSVYVSIED